MPNVHICQVVGFHKDHKCLGHIPKLAQVSQTLLHKPIIFDMLLCMRTTIDINDELLKATKAYAASERKTLKMAVEQALREFLASLDGPVVADAPPLPVFRGQGVQPGVDLTDNAALEDLMRAEP